MKELKDIEKSIIKKYRKEIYRRFIRAINPIFDTLTKKHLINLDKF